MTPPSRISGVWWHLGRASGQLCTTTGGLGCPSSQHRGHVPCWAVGWTGRQALSLGLRLSAWRRATCGMSLPRASSSEVQLAGRWLLSPSRCPGSDGRGPWAARPPSSGALASATPSTPSPSPRSLCHLVPLLGRHSPVPTPRPCDRDLVQHRLPVLGDTLFVPEETVTQNHRTALSLRVPRVLRGASGARSQTGMGTVHPRVPPSPAQGQSRPLLGSAPGREAESGFTSQEPGQQVWF